MVLFPKINEKKTKDNARSILKDYNSLKRRISYINSIPSSDYDLTRGIEYSDMPMHKSNRNGQENMIVSLFKWVGKREQNGSNELFEIERSINSLPTISNQILTYSYCVNDPYSLNQLASKIKGYRVNDCGELEEFTYSVKNIEKLKSLALIEFAEAYKSGKLLAFEK